MGGLVDVFSPVVGFDGTVAGVEFVGGVGAAPPATLAYFRRHGYAIGAPFDVDGDEDPDDGDGEPDDGEPDGDEDPDDGDGEPDDGEPDGDEDPDDGDEEPARPDRKATKAAWVAYATAMGEDPEDAAALTRAELADRYGAP